MAGLLNGDPRQRMRQQGDGLLNMQQAAPQAAPASNSRGLEMVGNIPLAAGQTRNLPGFGEAPGGLVWQNQGGGVWDVGTAVADHSGMPAWRESAGLPPRAGSGASRNRDRDGGAGGASAGSLEEQFPHSAGKHPLTPFEPIPAGLPYQQTRDIISTGGLPQGRKDSKPSQHLEAMEWLRSKLATIKR